MKLRFIYCIIFLVLSLYTKAQSKSNERINWLCFEQLTDSLNKNPKKVLLFFHTDWCSYCRKMMRETFQSPAIVNKINQEYYAVHFDAESTENIFFDGVIYNNSSETKKRGQYHQIAKILLGSNKVVFPTTVILKPDFAVKFKEQKYLSTKQLLKIL